MRTLAYTLDRDHAQQPLVELESPLGNGQELSVTALRALAGQLLHVADEAEQRGADCTGPGRRPTRSTVDTEGGAPGKDRRYGPIGAVAGAAR